MSPDDFGTDFVSGARRVRPIRLSVKDRDRLRLSEGLSLLPFLLREDERRRLLFAFPPLLRSDRRSLLVERSISLSSSSLLLLRFAGLPDCGFLVLVLIFRLLLELLLRLCDEDPSGGDPEPLS
jgi:hypothetical protein